MIDQPTRRRVRDILRGALSYPEVADDLGRRGLAADIDEYVAGAYCCHLYPAAPVQGPSPVYWVEVEGTMQGIEVALCRHVTMEHSLRTITQREAYTVPWDLDGHYAVARAQAASYILAAAGYGS